MKEVREVDRAGNIRYYVIEGDHKDFRKNGIVIIHTDGFVCWYENGKARHGRHAILPDGRVAGTHSEKYNNVERR